MFESGVSIVMLKGHVPESNATRNQLIPSVHIYIYMNVRSIVIIMSDIFHSSQQLIVISESNPFGLFTIFV